MAAANDSDAPLWQPTPERAAATSLAALARRVGVDDHASLHRWSVERPGELWDVLWDHLGVLGERGDAAVDPGDGSFLGARFFPEARLSFTENMLGHAPAADGLALVAVREGAEDRTWTWAELTGDVAAATAALRQAGIGEGDVVAAWMPNVGETVVVMLAALALGAVFTSTSPDFGATGVLDRFGQVVPRLLLACDGYSYGGKQFGLDDRLVQVMAGLPSLRQVVRVGVLGDRPSAPAGVIGYDEWLAPHRGAELDVPRFGFDHAGFVLYSSGTTGKPKCIVHRAAGVLVTHMKEHQLLCDVRPGDRVLYFTTCGWMMWNWLTSVLASGATAVLYDGSPTHPRPDVLFDVVDRWDVTLFGLSAKLIDAYRKEGLEPVRSHQLSHLRTICSTGSPLSTDGFRYVYEHVHPDVHLASISGGTDLCGCLVGGDPRRPVWAGEIQGPALGMDIDMLRDDGSSCEPGEHGELVCRRPFPSVPLGFWGDDDGSRFRAAYFERFPGVWAHGDFASWTEHGGMIIHGRSDATLNASGVRIGTAELYRVVESFGEVVECVAVGQEWDGDTRIVLFVRMAEGLDLDDALRDRLRVALRTECSPRHVPARIVQVADLPRTRSNKVSELAVADVVNGRTVRNTEALSNPESLAHYRDRPELST